MSDETNLNDSNESNEMKPTPVPSPDSWQLRVIDERDSVANNAVKLRVFIAENPMFKELSPMVQTLRQAQLFHMEQYVGILTEIIRLFQGGEEAPITKGRDLIGDFGTGNESVFILKYLSALMIDATDSLGNDPRRNAVVATDMEKVQMMAVKSVFSKPKNQNNG